MKKQVVIIVSLCLIFLVLAIVPLALLIPTGEVIKKSFADTSDVLLNPGKGFVDYGTMIYNGASDYVSIGYHRFNWADIETEEGVINFEKIDHKIQSYAERGKKFAFGIMCVNTSAEKEFITPEYVFEKGANYYMTKLEGSDVLQRVPDWKDEIYLNCVDNFVKALGQRYNGDKNIAFIDILSYGNWGEQHLFGFDIVGEPDYMEKAKITPEFFRERYMKPYMEAFPDTLLFNPWGTKEFNDVYEELIDEGVSLRRDGIVSYTNGLDMLEKCYGKLPVVFEYAGNYKDYIPDREEYFNTRLEEAIAIAKPTYIELDEDWFKNNLEYCAELANRMGYYFRLKNVQYNSKVRRGLKTKITLSFKNDGVAPLYENCFVYIGLLDGEGNLAYKYLTNLDAKSWLPGEQVDESVKIKFGNNVKKGSYTLALGLFLDENDQNPTYLLGSEGKTANNWYALGSIKII